MDRPTDRPTDLSRALRLPLLQPSPQQQHRNVPYCNLVRMLSCFLECIRTGIRPYSHSIDRFIGENKHIWNIPFKMLYSLLYSLQPNSPVSVHISRPRLMLFVYQFGLFYLLSHRSWESMDILIYIPFFIAATVIRVKCLGGKKARGRIIFI